MFVYWFGWRNQPGSQPDLKAHSLECGPSPAEPAHQADHRRGSKLKWSGEKTPEGTLGRDSPFPIREGPSPGGEGLSQTGESMPGGEGLPAEPAPEADHLQGSQLKWGRKKHQREFWDGRAHLQSERACLREERACLKEERAWDPTPE